MIKLKILISTILVFFSLALSAQVLSMPGGIPQAGACPGVWSVDLDGSADYLTRSDHDDFSFGNSTTDVPFSISAWIKTDNITANNVIAAKASEWEYMIESTGRMRMAIIDNTGTEFELRYSATSSIATATWYHVVMTYDGSGGESAQDSIRHYINGAYSNGTSTEGGTYVAMHNLTNEISIGRRTGGAFDYFGHIKDLAFWNIELSQSQINELYNAGVPPCVQNVSFFSNAIAFWEFNRNPYDHSPGGLHDATENGGIIYSTDVP